MNDNESRTWLDLVVAEMAQTGARSFTANVSLSAFRDALAAHDTEMCVSRLSDGRVRAWVHVYFGELLATVGVEVAGVDGVEVPPLAEETGAWSGLRLRSSDAGRLVALPGGDR